MIDCEFFFEWCCATVPASEVVAPEDKEAEIIWDADTVFPCEVLVVATTWRAKARC
jgi:hypothetical protein